MSIKTAAVTAVGLLLSLACSTAPAPLMASARPAGMPGPAAPPIPRLTWSSCHGGFQCATARVPLDYRHLARARLLTVRGYGHTEFLNPSTCATNFEVGYLLTGALPPAGTVCQQNAAPFPLPSGQ
jgi:hypothetical protein